MAHVRIVTDSTADIPPEVAESLSITVVPAYVQMGNRSYQDGVELSRELFYTHLPTLEDVPTTAVPPVEDFSTAYRRLLNEADVLVALTVSGRLSGMHDIASMAARDMPDREIHVLDSGQVSMGLGWIVIAAARAATAGASLEEITAIVNDLKPRVHVFAALDTAEYLHRSGRVSWATAKAADILRVKPVVTVTRGYVQQVGLVRTMHRAIDRLVDLCQALGPLEHLAILHTYSPLVDELHRRLAACYSIGELMTVAATTTIGVHVGPRALGAAAVCAK